MPSKSAKQARTMQAASHNPAFAKKMGIPQSVAREFVDADAQRRKRDEAHRVARAAKHVRIHKA